MTQTTQILIAFTSAILGGGGIASFTTYLLGRERLHAIETPGASIAAAEAANRLLLSQLESMRAEHREDINSLRKEHREEMNELRDTVSRQSQRLDTQNELLDTAREDCNSKMMQITQLQSELAAAHAVIDELHKERGRRFTDVPHPASPTETEPT